MVIDTHAHLLDSLLRDRAEEIVRDLKKDGVEYVVEICTGFANSPEVVIAGTEAHEALTFAEAHDNVYCTAGVHPMFAGTYSDEFEAWAVAHKGSKKIVAIGECGLDYYHMDFPKDVQRKTFVRQIKLADKLKLPLVVHSRDAFDDMFEILDEHKKYLCNGLILHCFSGGADEVNRFKVLDAYFAFGGPITYKDTSAEAVKTVPRDRLLIETDCPYLSPVPFRGRINEPKNVRIVAEHAAKILGLTFDKVAKLTSENAKRIFRI